MADMQPAPPIGSREPEAGPDRTLLGDRLAERQLSAAETEVQPPTPSPEPPAKEKAEPKEGPREKAEPKESPKEKAEPRAEPKAEPKEAKETKESKESAEAKDSTSGGAAAAESEATPLPISIARLVPKMKKSARLFEEGKKHIPNSSSSLIRVASYDPCPPFIAAGKGARIWDEDGNEYLDFNLAYGCLINGHAPREQVKAIQERAELGLHFAAPTALEIEVAKLFQKMVPTASKVAFCSNGSDATMNAIRIARAVTGKDAILKFEGHYHGQHDYALISAEAPPIVAGLDEYPRPIPNSAGIPPGVTDYVMVAQYNSVTLVRADGPSATATASRAVILEPIMANSGIIPPEPELPEADHRDRAPERHPGHLRRGVHGVPGRAGRRPAALRGRARHLLLGEGARRRACPISAVSGKAEYMDLIAPGRISFGGTYFANNISLAGTLANLKTLHKGGEDLYARFAGSSPTSSRRGSRRPPTTPRSTSSSSR